MIQVNGVNLSPPEPDIVSWVEATISLRDVYGLWQRMYWPGRLADLTFPGILPDGPDGLVRLGRLWWPKLASRWGRLHLIVDATQLTAIRAGASTGFGASPLPVVLSWEDAVASGNTVASITANLFPLPPLPLSLNAPNAPSSYLLTLVDDRFFWWSRSSGVIVVNPLTSWDSLLFQIRGALGVSLSWDTIPAVYLNPSTDFGVSYEYLPILLDAAFYNVGQRLVANLDGTYRGRTFANGLTDIAANLALASARSLQAGGPVGTADSNAVTAQTLLVAFPKKAGGLFTSSAPTGGAHPDTKAVHDNLVDDGTNEASLTALATQMAADYGAQFRGGGDWKFAGVVPWQPDPIDDAVEWSYRLLGGPAGDGEVSTRVYPPAWNDLTSDGLHASGTIPPSPPAQCCICSEFDFSISGLDPALCGGNGSWALVPSAACNCCMWCSVSGPGGGEACLTLKPGLAGSIGILEICTGDNCCATYRGIVSDCNSFTLNLCDTCGSGGAGWPGSVTITCNCTPGSCSFCTTSAGAPSSFAVSVPTGFFSTSPLSLFNGTSWTLAGSTPCVWTQCQTDPTTLDVLCMTLTILGVGTSQLLLQVFSPSGTGPPLASALLTDNTDPAGGDCCSNSFVFGLGGCCDCTDYQFGLSMALDSPCLGMDCTYDLSPSPGDPCRWHGQGTGPLPCRPASFNPTATLTQTPGSPIQWTLFIEIAGGGCEVTYSGTSVGCRAMTLTQSNNPNYPFQVTVNCVAGPAASGGGGDGGGTLTAVPTCCGVQQVSTPCCPDNKINKTLHAKVQLTSIHPCPINGVVVTLDWFKGGTGPCPTFSGAQNFDYWFGTAPTSGDNSIVLLMYCDTIHGTATWRLFGVCTTAPPDCATFANAFTLNNFFTPSQPADCSVPTIIFGLGSIGASCCGAFGGTGTITVTD